MLKEYITQISEAKKMEDIKAPLINALLNINSRIEEEFEIDESELNELINKFNPKQDEKTNEETPPAEDYFL